ncbi:hypothetical protein C5167_028775 [Papaver somniferum]|nr:hypothetical protein C5167_028775 [Papaver somniferum]
MFTITWFFSHFDSTGRVFHRGVQCDVGVVLVGSCYFSQGPAPPSPYLPHIMQDRGNKEELPYLKSHFIQDVNIPDGTLVSPLTSFT